MSFQGHVTSVDLDVRGDELTAAASIGATVLPVVSVVDFDETGGHALINDEVYTYSDVDLDADTITLDAGLVVAAAEGDRLDVWNPATGTTVAEWVAVVADDLDGSALTAVVAHALIDLLGDGVRGLTGESVLCEPDPETGDLMLVQVIGKTPVVDGSYVDPGSLPDPTLPTEAPVTSPEIVAVAGMPSTIMVRTEQPPVPSTLIRYEASVDGVAWQAYSEPTASTVFVANALPDLTPFAPDATYYFRAWATNVVGDAPAPSAVVEGKLDLGAVAIVAAQVVTEEVFAGFILTGEIQVGGTNLVLSATEGIVVRATNGTETRFPTDGSPAKFGGDVVARTLQVEQGAELNGASKVGGTMRLQAQVEDPERGPTIREDWWPDNRLPVDGSYHSPVGLVRNAADNGWEILCVEESTSQWGIASVLDAGFGVVASFASWSYSSAQAAYQGLCVVQIGGNRHYATSAEWVTGWTTTQSWIEIRNAAHDVVGSIPPNGGHPWDVAHRRAVGVLPDGQTLVVAWADHDGGAQRIRYQTLAVGYNGSVVDLTSVGSVVRVQETNNRSVTGVAVGTFDYDGSIGDRIVFAAGGTFIVAEYGVNNAPQRPTEGWQGPDGRAHRGLAIRGAKFNSIGKADGVVVRYEPHQTESQRTSHWAYTWRDDDTHRTAPSPRTQIVARNRCILVIEADPAPQEGDGLDHGAKQIDVYAAQTAVSTLYRQEPLPEGVRASYKSNSPLYAGTPAPASSNFGEVAVSGHFFSQAVDDDGVPLINLKGDGTIGNDSGDVTTSGTYAGTMRFVRFGNVVWANGYTTRASGSSSSLVNTGIVVPIGFRPAAQVVMGAAPFYSGSGADALYRYYVETDGNVRVQMTAANSTFMTLNGVWFTAD